MSGDGRWVALLGGTFDPIHLGHLAMARAALRLPEVEEVRLVPAAVPPHKEGAPEAAFADRLEMVRRAIEGMEGLSVWDLEGRRPGPSFTVDTMAEAERILAPRIPVFLMGGDSLAELPTWKDPETLLSRYRLLVVRRPGAPAAAGWVSGHPHVVEVPMEETPISSTEVRRRIREGNPLSGWVPDAVADYIRERGLYRRA